MTQINPLLLKLKMPGRIFPLPSKGILYKNNELYPTASNGEIQVKPLSAMSEIKMRSADLLFSGRAIDEIIKECITDVNKPFDLFSKDIDAILCFLRIVTYGQFFDLEVEHTCDKARSRVESVDLERVTMNMKPLTEEIVAMYNVILSNGQHVKLTPLRYSALIDLLQMQKDSSKLTQQEIETLFIKNFTEIIESVDDVTDKKLIGEWISFIGPVDADKIRDAFEKANEMWGITLLAEVKCKDCGEVYTINIPVDPVGFFSV